MTGEDDTYHRESVPPTRQSVSAESLPNIDGFRIQSVHGEGGMARVYLAKDISLDRMVAIKMMNSVLSEDSEFRIRFENEAKIVAKFRHPNVVSVHASGDINSAKYIVMEFVNGGNLFDKLKSGALAEEEVVDVARQMANALAYAHDRGIVHRDIKPGNILFAEDGTPVLTDFGIAKSSSNEFASMTKVGMVMGSLQYMAPEQARGMVVTNRTDIYSFGLVIYEMLTADLPAKALVDSEVEDQVREALSGCRKKLVDLVCRCLQINPEDRPSAEECHDSLNSISREIQSTNRWEVPGLKTTVVTASGLLALIIAAFALAALGKPPFASNNVIQLWVSSFMQPILDPVEFRFEVQPSSTALYLDGNSIDKIVELAPGSYDVVAVSPGYFGRVFEVTVGGEVASTSITLQPITLPAQAELGRFVASVEAPQVMMGDLRNVIDPALRQVLELKQLVDSEATAEAARLSRKLDMLASFDDQASAVSLYLAANSEILERDPDGLLPRLRASMESGYALATFWFAIRLREELSAEPAAPGSVRHVRYCESMQRAHDQGLRDIARQYLDSQEECGMLQ